MRLTDYIKDLGRVVAYYPNLKRVTGSTTASILLCQLLYWTDKTEDGWIWKDSGEIEEETGLTYNEQRTARKHLQELNLVTEHYRRLSHKYIFKVNQDELNRLWEQSGGKEVQKIETKRERKNRVEYNKTKKVEFIEEEPEYEIEEEFQEEEKLTEEQKKIISGEISVPKSDKQVTPEEERDWFLQAVGGETAQKVNSKIKHVEEIRQKIEEGFVINAKGTRWDKFIEFVYTEETKHKRPINAFIDWANRNGFDPLYWTPEKMQTMYPQAFAEIKKDDDFMPKLPPIEEDESQYIPMPDYIKKKIKLD